MRREQFIQFVKETIEKNPDWFGDMIQASQYAVLDRLDTERQRRVDAESIVMVLYQKVYKEDDALMDQMEDKAKEVLKKAWEGTEYAKNL